MKQSQRDPAERGWSARATAAGPAPRGNWSRRRWSSVADALIRPLAQRVIRDMHAGWRFLPPLPAWCRRRTAPPRGPWPDFDFEVPEALRGEPGIRTDPALVRAALERTPVYAWVIVHDHAMDWLRTGNWKSFSRVLPRFLRLNRAVERTATQPLPPLVGFGSEDSERLTSDIKALARSVGLSAVGVAPFDPSYIATGYEHLREGDRVVVCILEQNYAATQTAPSFVSDVATYNCEIDLGYMAVKIAEHLQRSGYRAHAHEPAEEALTIPYAVAAGLGQLGLNGQLLTPAAGSRCRLTLVSTNAPLVADTPVDYGINAICDGCRACVRRCPAKALTSKRRMYRGVEKAKLNTARCAAVLQIANDCAVCMRVCPVQKYGLGPIYEEFERSGEILGVRTDELEGFDWPLDGRHYAPGHRPPIPDEIYEQEWVLELPTTVPREPREPAERVGARLERSAGLPKSEQPATS